ncbi:BspA family leucine-rich repeat surface protein [Listeria monocytogenes]|nr:BspA family leucine-rich repeat surface protein [Listeria monocytogenes]EAF2801483.1 BspA family leucine-rich repeat surface protein [Listeria monocytogenes]
MFYMKKRKKGLRQLVVAFLLLCTIGLLMQNIVLANENEQTINEPIVAEETETKEGSTVDSNISNSESVESEIVPTSEKETESIVLDESTQASKEINTSGIRMEELKANSVSQQSEERPSTKVVTSGTFPNGSTATWNFDDATGTLTISGGTLVDPKISVQSLTKIPVNEITNIVLEDKVFLSGSCASLFLSSVVTSLDLSNFDTSNVTNMNGMFHNSAATSLDLSSFDTSNVTTMSNMFRDSAATSLDVSNFDTNNVNNMHDMFRGSAATSLDLSDFDTSNVNDMSYMFYGSTATSLDVSKFDTSNVTDMIGMFQFSAATSLDVSKFDTSNVTHMSSMFTNSAATSLDVSKFDTSNVTDMSSMFTNSAATSLDLSDFDTSNVNDMSYMFYGSAATSLDVSKFDTSNVNDMSYMFYGSAVTSLDVSGFDTRRVIMGRNMFGGTTQLQNITLGRWFQFLGIGIYSENLPNPPTTVDYTGKWQNVGSGTVDKPKGSFVGTATELMSTYDGSTMADTYVWQPVLLEVNVQDSTLMVGDTWNPADNFLSGLDSVGDPVDFNAITVTGSVDTTQPGVHSVDYSYGGITSTATITVLETMPASWVNFFVDGTNVRAIPGSALSTAKWDLTTGLWDKWNPGTVKVATDKIPSEPTKQGYEFKGWKDTTGAIVDFSILDLDLNNQNEFDFYAAFEKKEYTVTFDVDGKKETQKVLFEDLINEPTAPKKEKHKFDGWHISPQTKTTKWDFSTMGMPANHLTLYAKFTKLSDSGSGTDLGGSGTPSKPISPVKPEQLGNKESTSDFTSSTGSTKITSQENTMTASPTMSQGGKLAKLGESSSLFLQGFGLLMLISGTVFFWKKRKKTHS